MENGETLVWLDFSLECGYIDGEAYKLLVIANAEVGRLIGHMIRNPEKYDLLPRTIKWDLEFVFEQYIS